MKRKDQLIINEMVSKNMTKLSLSLNNAGKQKPLYR